MIKLIKIFLFILLGIYSHHMMAQDTIYLYSGSVLAGKLKKIDLGMLSFDIKDAAVVNIQLVKVRTMSIKSKPLKIETIQYKSLMGDFYYSPIDGFTRMVTHNDSMDIMITHIVSAIPFGESFRNSITAYIGGGYNYTKSSDVGRINLDGRFEYTKERYQYSFNSSFIMTQDGRDINRDNENVTLGAKYYLSPIWFSGLSLNYQRNLQLGLKARYQEGIVLGNRFFTTPLMQAKIFSGYVLNQEENTEGFKQDLLSEIPIGLLYNFYHYRMPRVLITVSEVTYFGINQNGRIRQDGDLDFTWKFWGDLSLSLSLYHNYDSAPPSAGNPNLDYGIIFSAGYEIK
jgi:hypothetical protein